jgi:DNA polymerase III gamma/tau subunit
MSLYLKYRPANLDEMRGNSQVITALKGMLSNLETCPHSFLLHGPTGCGKTTIGRIIAIMLGCKGYDLREINSADFRGIDTIRDLIKSSQFMAMESSCMVWLVDEVHKMTNDAQNALLKILEDTPKHVYFILCTTEPQKLLATIKGRCSQFQLLPIDETEMRILLKRIARRESTSLDEAVLNQIVNSAKGLPRNALQILEQVLNVVPEQRMEAAKKAEAEVIQSIELCRALIKRASWSTVATILSGLKDQEAEGIRRAVLGYCQAILLNGKDEPLCGLIMEEFMSPFYDSGFPQLVYAAYSVTKNK